MSTQQPGSSGVEATEDQGVRQYRYLLATAPLDALVAAHEEALAALTPDRRAAVLDAVQRGLVAGQRLAPDDLPAVSRLLVRGEKRSPGDFRRACDPTTLVALAGAVVASEAAFGLFGGYAAWDGEDATPTDAGVDHGGEPGNASDPAGAAWALAHSHTMSQQPWGGGGF
ncbi:hypothetical protein [Knoellia koreensis]|uniref:Uncharacterized protein n=1 Tax=Knoellia koreensis TaxID=2730921 RepID=A0A849HDS0_9MICO|nr:hypothetical protein [Knoellia sp. DB2414S]NNM47876.1 hypothetical protein [Knoellia sp. DB2414S]